MPDTYALTVAKLGSSLDSQLRDSLARVCVDYADKTIWWDGYGYDIISFAETDKAFEVGYAVRAPDESGGGGESGAQAAMLPAALIIGVLIFVGVAVLVFFTSREIRKTGESVSKNPILSTGVGLALVIGALIVGVLGFRYLKASGGLHV
jgi:hypothetical protein